VELEAEADDTAARLAAMGAGTTIWLFCNGPKKYAGEVTNILKPRLDRRLTFVKALYLSNWWFDNVVVYKANSKTASPPSGPLR
jgi:hypothetical protein